MIVLKLLYLALLLKIIFRKNIVSLTNKGSIDSILDKLNAYHAYMNNKDRQ